MGSASKYRSRLAIVLSLASCILSVSLAKSEARYHRGYSGFRRNFSPGYFRGYSSSYGRSDYHHKAQHHQHSGLRKYGYKIVSPPAPDNQGEKDRFIPAPVKPRIVSPTFNLDIDLASEQPAPVIASNKIDADLNNPLPPPAFPARIQRPQPLANQIPIPAPIPAVPAVRPQPSKIPAVRPQPSEIPAVRPQLSSVPAVPEVRPQPSEVPAVVRADLPLLPEAIPAVPGRPILSDSAQPESAGNIFVPMPVPAVPGL